MKSGNGVAVGHEGWLYWVGRAREVETFYGDTAASRRILGRWGRLIARRARRLDKLGIRHVHTVVPDKLAVYPDRLGRPFPGLDDPPGVRLGRLVARDSAAVMVDLLAPLSAARAEEPVYLRTDTHWTYRGYLTAYRALCEALDAPVAEHVFAGSSQQERFTFDLGEKLTPPVDEEYVAYDFPRRAERTAANALVRVGGFAPPQDSATKRTSPCRSRVRALACPPSKPIRMSLVRVSVTSSPSAVATPWK